MLHGQIGRFRAPQNLVDLNSNAHVHFGQRRSVGQEPSGLRKYSPKANRRQATLRHLHAYAFQVRSQPGNVGNERGVGTHLPCTRVEECKIVRGLDSNVLDLYSDGLRGIQVHQVRGIGPCKDGVGHPRYLGERRFQDLQLLFGIDSQGEAREIATGARHGPDKACFHWIAGDGKHDRNVSGRLLGGPSRSLARGNDEIDLSPNEVGCEVWQLIQIVRIAWRKPDILALDPTQLAQRLHEGWLDLVDALSQKSNGPIHELVTKPARINRSLLRIRPGA